MSGRLADRSGRQRGWDLPDRDVAVIDAKEFTVTYVNRLMNLCMAIMINPSTGDVTVVGTDATNEIRFEPNLQGRFLRVNLAIADASAKSAAVVDLNPHLTYDTPRIEHSQRAMAIGDPRGIVWNSSGTRGFVTGRGSNNLVMIGANGARIGEPPGIGEGPTGMALGADGDTLYVLNHFEATISVVSGLRSDSLAEQTRVPLSYDPTPQLIKAGCKHLYNTHINSGLGQIACGSCHVEARMDRLAESVAVDDLRNLAAGGSALTYTVVPLGTERRIGIDRDQDGYLDRDELDAGSNPNDPDSIPR